MYYFILIDQGVYKLSDFGVSVYTPGVPRRTFCGTLDYVCPEILLGYDYDYSVDIWALGILTYEIYAGRAPFASDKDEITQQNILNVFSKN